MAMQKVACAAFALALSAIFTSCVQKSPAPPDGSAPMSVAEALANPARTEADRADDAMRKPDKVLAFIGVAPGMSVFEMEAGAGYYTELFSALVGPKGEIVMHNPESFDAFLGDAVTTRINGRLDNVRVAKSNFDALDAPDNSMDMVTWMLGPHDLYYEPAGAPLGDDAGAFAEAMRILKPGGAFIVLDHAALAGSPKSTGGTLHRIDPAIVRQLAEDAGFALAAESDVLRNADDNHEITVFDPSIRRQTDRFIFNYKKPE